VTSEDPGAAEFRIVTGKLPWSSERLLNFDRSNRSIEISNLETVRSGRWIFSSVGPSDRILRMGSQAVVAMPKEVSYLLVSYVGGRKRVADGEKVIS
jgi:hypothetical protein